mmetsp:Transcript_6771/g.41344  ORF Transcript_6771/g.41344 Transcript_6771/m.41344 type:complete len:103 (+) Transcript_6771:2687-2995(+)
MSDSTLAMEQCVGDVVVTGFGTDPVRFSIGEARKDDFTHRRRALAKTGTLNCVCNGELQYWSSLARFAHRKKAMWCFSRESVCFQHLSMLCRSRMDLSEARS